jgi:hypothetical protein
VFPRPGEPAPELRLCELHLRRSLENALAPLDGEPDHPVQRASRHAHLDHHNWTRFTTQVGAVTNRRVRRCPRWRAGSTTYGELVADQLATRSALGPNSTGAVAASLRQVEHALAGRSQSFGNGPRLNLLLDLITLHANDRADPRCWADRLRERLHPRDGIAPQQGPHDDPRHQPSLIA